MPFLLGLTASGLDPLQFILHAFLVELKRKRNRKRENVSPMKKNMYDPYFFFLSLILYKKYR